MINFGVRCKRWDIWRGDLVSVDIYSVEAGFAPDPQDVVCIGSHCLHFVAGQAVVVVRVVLEALELATVVASLADSGIVGGEPKVATAIVANLAYPVLAYTGHIGGIMAERFKLISVVARNTGLGGKPNKSLGILRDGMHYRLR